MKTLHTIYTNFAKRVLMVLALITMGVGTVWGAEELLLTLDFTTNNWGFPNSSSNKTTTEKTYTSGNYSIKLAGGGNSNGHYFNSDGYLILGKSGATLTLPAFDSKTTKIIINGRDGASEKVTQNIFVGSTAVSTATTGAKGSNTYEIAAAYQDAGNVYVLKVTSDHNTQITSIQIYGEEVAGGGNDDTGDGCTWELVTDASTLAAGDRIVIAASGYDYAISTTQNSNNRAQAEIEKSNDKKTISALGSTVQIITLEAGTKSGTLAFNVGSGYLYAASSGSNYLRTEETLSANSSWAITIASTGVATIKAQGTNTRNWLRYNSSNNPPIFSCYGSGQSDVVIYKEICAKETTINLYPNFGTALPTTITTGEKSYTVPACEFEREGYTFSNWNTKSDGNGDNYDPDDEITLNGTEVNLYAQWTAQQYNIIYKDQNDANFSGNHQADYPTKHTYGTATALKDATKTGYTFGGWYKEPACSTSKVTTLGATDYTSDITLYAKWTPNTYTVQFDANSGTGTMSNQPFTYDVSQDLSENTYTRTGYNFTGWNTAANGSGTAYADKAEVKNLTAELNGVVTLYAQWEEKKLTNFRTLCEYNIEYINTFGVTHSNPETYTIKDLPLVFRAPTTPREGYTFLGWEPASLETDARGSQIVVAKWKINNYTVTWDANGGLLSNGMSKSVESRDFGATITPVGTPTLIGHTFLGWDENGEGIKEPATTMPAKDLLYTAQWQVNSYTLTWELNGGTVITSGTPEGQVAFGTAIKAPKVEKDGYTFVGWEPEVPATMPAENVTYTAIFENCRWVETEIGDVQPDDEVVVVITTKEGKTWALPHSGGSNTQPTAISVTVDGNSLSNNIDNAIKWNIANDEGNLTFYPNGTTETWLYCIDNNNGVRVGTNANNIYTIDLSNGYLKHTVTGRYVGVYSNQDWRCYTSINNSNIPGQTLKFYSRVCLEDNQHWINYQLANVNCTTVPKPVYVNENEASLNLTFAAATGFTLPTTVEVTMGSTAIAHTWNNGILTIEQPTGGFTDDITITIVGVHTVTFDMQGHGDQIAPQIIAHQATVAQPTPAPSETGYTFGGWYTDAACNNVYNFSKPVIENMTLYAKWTANTYTVTWDANGGYWTDYAGGTKEDTYDYGAPIVKPADPKHSGRVFDGWKPEVATTMPANNLTYIAEWKEAYCNNFSFHWGSGSDEHVKVHNDQECFVKSEDPTKPHEWYVFEFTIPADNKYFVGERGYWYDGSLGSGGSKSVMKEWTWTGDQVMYIEPVGRGCTLGHAVGAFGTLRIYDDTDKDNLDVAFIPNGYKLKFGSTEYVLTHHEAEQYHSELVQYNSTTAEKQVSVGVVNKDGGYIKTAHTQEGMRHIFLKVNSNWKDANAKFAIYYWDNNGNGWSAFMKTVPGETDMYEGWIPENYINFKFVRLKNDAGTPNWENKWNETGNLTLHKGKTLYTIPSGTWDGADDNDKNWSTYTRKGKFRIYNNSWDKNWYVHFYPHYVITFDKNAADATGTMPPQALPLDANPMTIVLNECGFTRTGYDFVSWNTKADGKGTSYQPGATYTMTGDTTLYAIWKAQTYHITYKDQGDDKYSGENSASLPQTRTYDKKTTLVDGVKTGYTFEGWYDTPECDGTVITELGAKDYTADITLYAKWTFAMEYDITNTETIFITSAKGQTVKAATQLTLQVNNMPEGSKVAMSAPNITFYDEAGNAVSELTTKYNPESFKLTAAYTPTTAGITEQPTITLSVLDNEKTFEGLISARSLPETFAVVAKVGNMWYALPSQGLNATDDLMGYPVEVDNQDDPMVVTKAPANADWSLRQVYAGQNANATKDRFKQYGANLVFVNSDVKALSASQSKNYVLTDATYEAYKQSDNQGLYEWTPTTTDLETYQLTNEQRTERKLSIDILTRFGIYAGEITNMRFLPIKERYIPASLQVVEWKENSVVVMYTGDPSQTATLAIDGTTQIGNANLNDNEVNKDVAIYELPASGLMNYATKRLLITIGNGQKWLTIPYIINNSTTDVAVLNSTSTTKAVAAVTDVVVLNGATFTAAGTKSNKYTFRTIHVYGGGKLVVPASAADGFGIYSLVMRLGTVKDGTYTNSYPQLVMNGKYSNTSGIYLDYITTYERYYALSVPYPVKTKNIKYPADIYGDNLKSGNKASFALQYYDGAARATGATGWKDFDESGDEPTLTPYQGYTFWGAPRKVSVNGGDAQRPKFGIHRIPLTGAGADSLLTAETTAKTIGITAHPAERPNDMGWNFLGNPYLAQYGGLSAEDEDVQVGLLGHEMVDGKWTGGWKHTGNLRYVTTTTDGQNYTAVEVDKATFSPFNTFFIQAATNGALSFVSASRAQSLPARHYAAQQESAKEITTGIILTGNDQTDRTGLLIADNFTEEYDFNADLSKFENSGINLYTIGKDGKLAYMAINQALAEQPIPVGYSAPAEGLYTIAFDEDRYNATDISALYLIDYDSNEKTNLLLTDYSFVTAAGTNNQRFALQVAFAPENATNVEWIGDATIQVGVEGNELILNNLPTDAAVHVFDALGRLMYHTPHAPTEMQLTLPTGYYLVRIADKQHAAVINTVIP